MGALKTLAVVSLLGAIAWFVWDPGFEPALAIVAAIVAFISAKVVETRRATRQQSQSVSNSSVGIQAGRDVQIGNRDSQKHDR